VPFAFVMEGPLPSKALCGRRAFKVPFSIRHRRAFITFAIEGPLASKCTCFCHRRAFAIEGLCHRRDFALLQTTPSL
jgi:hypothetical protein